jgi:hypothetical protein
VKRWQTALFSKTFQYPALATIILIAISVWYYRFAVKGSEAEVAVSQDQAERSGLLAQITQLQQTALALRTVEQFGDFRGAHGDGSIARSGATYIKRARFSSQSSRPRHPTTESSARSRNPESDET